MANNNNGNGNGNNGNGKQEWKWKGLSNPLAGTASPSNPLGKWKGLTLPSEVIRGKKK